jgi:3-oxoadipate enol-lactonase
MTLPIHTKTIPIKGGELAVHIQGPNGAPAIVMAHSILSSAMMWQAQSDLLSACGFQVICADTRGHGQSSAPQAPYHMNDLAQDCISIMDALGLEKAHYVGLSLGAMSGFGLALNHAPRLLSVLLCDGRADMTPAFAQPWDERMEMAKASGVQVLAAPTVERWFGTEFVNRHPELSQRFIKTAGATSLEGFIGCAKAIQSLDYLAHVSSIKLPMTLLVGANDGPLPQAMTQISTLVPQSKLEIIPNAGHLPNIDQSALFNAALMRHFFQNPQWSQS